MTAARKYLTTAMAGAALVGGVLFSTAVPADAHLMALHHGNDTGVLAWDHSGLTACDSENDGRSVTMYGWSGGTRFQATDTYGGGCTTRGGIALWIDHVQLCEGSLSPGNCTSRVVAP